MIKIYQTINDINLTTSVATAGKRAVVKFIGGSVSADGKVLKFGCFSTDNLELQNAIEKDSGYGKSFKCVGESELRTEPTPDANLNPELTNIANVSNTNLAIEWIEANTEHKFIGRPNKAEVLDVAKSLNVNFVDWKQ